MVYKLLNYRCPKDEMITEGDFNIQLLYSKIEMQEQTFSLIGKELQDNIGQLLSTSRILIGLVERSLKTPPDALIRANATLGKAINEIRSLSKSLDEKCLPGFDLLENLKAEIIRINAYSNIRGTLHIQSAHFLTSSEQIILFRMIQEAIQNAIEYSGCKNIGVHINKKDRFIEINISDDGPGRRPDIMKKGTSLSNIQYRAKVLGGHIKYKSSDKGTRVIIFIPR